MSDGRGMYNVVATDEYQPSGDSRDARNKRKYARLIWRMLIVLAVVLLIVIGAVVGAYFIFHKTESGRADPCDDFYQYSCGDWLSSNGLDGRDSWGTFYQLAIDNYHHLRSYMSEPPNEDDPDAIKKTKYAYAACTNVDYIQVNLVDHLRDFIRLSGGWDSIGISGSDWSWTTDDLSKDHYLGSSAFFEFGVQPDDINSSLPVIKISQAGLTLSSPQMYENNDNFEDLVDMINNVLVVVGISYEYHTLARDIANYERELARESLTDTELRNVAALYNPMTLQELQNLFNMDWTLYFDNIFSSAEVTADFDHDSVVIVETPSYFRNINRYLSSSTAVDYAKWQLLINEIAFSAASLGDDSWGILWKTKFPKTSKLGESSTLACVEFVEIAMPFAIARPFVEEFVTDNTTNVVNETANQILNAFVERLMDKDWLDDVTKDQCMDKVDAITRQIAYPDFIKIDRDLDRYYENLAFNATSNHFKNIAAYNQFQIHQQLSTYNKPIDKTEWQAPPTEVNAYYSPEFNQFVFLAGILRPPFFASNWPPYQLYGAFGAVVGHELTHGFDDQGQQYNKDGNRIQWWTNQSIANFKERTQCFVDQYNQYSLQGYQIDGQLTLGENIADNGGLHTAFRAYINSMNATERQSKIGGHTLDQLFFMSFAQLWCSKFSGDALESSTQTDPHSPGPIRVLGSIVNSDEFATAFNCSSGSRMNPVKKCLLW